MANDPFKNFKPLNSAPANRPKSGSPKGDSFVESLRGIGGSAVNSIKNDVVKGTAQSIFNQLLGSAKTGRMPTTPDQAINPDLEKYIAEKESQAATEARSDERMIQAHKHSGEQILFSFADEKVRKEIEGVRSELQMLVATMGKVEKQIDNAIMDNIVDAGVYHLNYFAKLKSWIIFMRKSLEDASAWLAVAKGRNGNKGYYWNQVAKSGNKYSMSQERQVQMGAG